MTTFGLRVALGAGALSLSACAWIANIDAAATHDGTLRPVAKLGGAYSPYGATSVRPAVAAVMEPVEPRLVLKLAWQLAVPPAAGSSSPA